MKGDEFLFCDLCGTMLSFDCPSYVSCSMCKNRRDAKDIAGKEICYTIVNERLRRNLNQNQLDDTDGEIKKLEVNEPCPKCGNDKLQYYVKQPSSMGKGLVVVVLCQTVEISR